ncbi:hypothetical protein IAD21_02933 [Abditibacteriota bacterium]|nr:hypothetical protein IAD21_02933 [Abditibacteriota bacterium]
MNREQKPFDLRERTKLFALEVIDVVERLPRNRTADVLGKQLLRCATSVGANTRAAKRAKSNADFISKMGTVEEEADECEFWLDLLEKRGLIPSNVATDLRTEANELVAIVVASINKARAKR